MKPYTKPMILSCQDMAEGVFAGSGSQALTIANFSVSLGNEYAKSNTYTFDLINNTSETIDNWSYTFTITAGTATSVVSHNTASAYATLLGNKIIVTAGQWCKSLAPGQSAVSIQLCVSYEDTPVEIQ